MNSPAPASRPNLTALIVLAAVVAAFGLWLGMRFAKAPAQPKLASALLYPEPRAISDFALQQANGKPLTLADWRGHWNFVYFGYTTCPDVCPTTLAELKSVWAELGKRGVQDKLRFDFVSVDPDRDTADALAKYVGFFSPDFVAATGTDAELTKLTRSLGILSVAEGIETREELHCVARAGCTKVQGFYFSRPVPISELNAVLMECPHKFALAA